PQRKAASKLAERSSADLFATKQRSDAMQEHRFCQRDSEVPKSTRTLVRVSSARARGKRPPGVEDPTQLPLVLFI
ncbi:hypothetical protein ACTL32_09380, partial [Planococcus sp. FY231025]|uniref:hypothetical protein n=1 Tax=Planococcus sp. FY231025 TaxID=3455699 RepID=UPI003F8FA5F3